MRLGIEGVMSGRVVRAGVIRGYWLELSVPGFASRRQTVTPG